MTRGRVPVKQWCNNCKEVVEVTPVEDMDTGYIYYECPECGEEDCEDIGRCKCGEPMGECDELCPGCIESVKDAIARFDKMLPMGTTAYEAFTFAYESNWI